MARHVNNNPIGARLLLIKKKFFNLKIKLNIDKKVINEKQPSPIHADGT